MGNLRPPCPSWAVLAAVLQACSAIFVSAQAADTYRADFASRAGQADLTIYVDWRPTRPKAFIGECRGFPKGDRISIFLTDDRASADLKVRIVDDPDSADWVFCTD